MDSIILENPQIMMSYKESTTAIEILFCIMLVVLVAKEIIQFGNKMYEPLNSVLEKKKKYEDQVLDEDA